MTITDQADADRYFEHLVQGTMSLGKTREEAERIERERSNLSYYAGHHLDETRERVEPAPTFCGTNP